MPTIPRVHLGKNGPLVGALGLGCGGMSPGQSEAESIATIHAALDAGMSMLNTADFYGMGHNEALIGRAIKDRRDKAFVSVKFGMLRSPGGKFLGIEGRPTTVKAFAAYSLQRLGVDAIDLYQPGRPDPSVPYEETIGAIADLVKEGKVRHVGVSEIGADLLKRAHAVHPISALEIEYSLACRFSEAEILPIARALGIGIVAYRVLADGLLTGATAPAASAHFVPPRMEGDALKQNVETCRALLAIAERKRCSPAQLAVAWLRSDDVVPLIGINRRARLDENLAAIDVTLTADERAELDAAFAPGKIVGDRYPTFVMKYAAR